MFQGVVFAGSRQLEATILYSMHSRLHSAEVVHLALPMQSQQTNPPVQTPSGCPGGPGQNSGNVETAWGVARLARRSVTNE